MMPSPEIRQTERPSWEFRLYVAGVTPSSQAAAARIETLCREYLGTAFNLEVVDLSRDRGRAREDDIIAIPTLVRLIPEPPVRLIGDLSQTDRIVIGLEFPPLPTTGG